VIHATNRPCRADFTRPVIPACLCCSTASRASCPTTVSAASRSVPHPAP